MNNIYFFKILQSHAEHVFSWAKHRGIDTFIPIHDDCLIILIDNTKHLLIFKAKTIQHHGMTSECSEAKDGVGEMEMAWAGRRGGAIEVGEEQGPGKNKAMEMRVSKDWIHALMCELSP